MHQNLQHPDLLLVALRQVLDRVPEVEFEVALDEALEGGNGRSKELVAEMLV